MIEGVRIRENKREKNVGWSKRVPKFRRVTDALKATRDQDAWKFMIAITKEQGN